MLNQTAPQLPLRVSLGQTKEVHENSVLEDDRGVGILLKKTFGEVILICEKGGERIVRYASVQLLDVKPLLAGVEDIEEPFLGRLAVAENLNVICQSGHLQYRRYLCSRKLHN